MDTQTLISFLTWALITVGGGLIGSVVWFALRIVKQLDRLEDISRWHARRSRADRVALSLADLHWYRRKYSRPWFWR